jgi:hypothetical protein
MTHSTHLDETNEAERASRWDWIRSWAGSAPDRRNQRRVVAWLGVWGLYFLLAGLLLRGNLPALGINLEVEGPWAWVVAAGSTVLLAVVLIAFLRFFRMADELTRLIHVQALAVGFGAWFFLEIGWKLFVAAGAAPLAGTDTAVIVPVFAYALSQLYFAWRYR